MKNSIKDTKYGIITSNKFNKQVKKIIKLGKNIEKLSNVVKKLANGETTEFVYNNYISALKDFNLFVSEDSPGIG